MGVFICIVLLMVSNVYARQCRILEENSQNAPPPLQIITRSEWMAQPPTDIIEDLALPIPYVVIIHTATGNCTDLTSCSRTTRQIQTYHMESKHWSDIAYNFLIGGDGKVYEGRGWNKQGAHSKSYNSRSIGIAFIGNYENHIPTNSQLDAAKLLIDMGVLSRKLAIDYRLFGHRQVILTSSPGDALYMEIKKWPHFSTL